MTDAGARAREALHEEALSKAEFDLLGYPDPISADLCDRIVRVYLKHMASAGFKLVPRRADEAMWKAGAAGMRGPLHNCASVWEPMHDAAPPLPPEEGR